MEDFLAAVRRFAPRHDGNDLVWEFWLRDGRVWTRVMVRSYRETYFLSAGDGGRDSLPRAGSPGGSRKAASG